MYLKVSKSKTGGVVNIPGSKSHTIRAVFLASLANGKSVIHNPLFSKDTESAIETCKALGAQIEKKEDTILVKGFNGIPDTPADIIDVGNSGTTLNFAIAASALGEGYSAFTGDYQIRRRPIGALIEACNDLGANVFSTRNNGCAPVIVKGRLKGGNTALDCGATSQYLSSLLISTPFAESSSYISLLKLNEVPYVEITLKWLDKLGICYENKALKEFYIPGGQRLEGFEESIPGDFSSATFFMVLAAISGGQFTLKNLDINDSQGDKHVLDILKAMGTKVDIGNDSIIIKGNGLKGMEIDMNSIPDALPAMAVAGCFAEGETRLVNVPQARLKETDRINVMCRELKKMGANIEELPDGLVIRNSRLEGCRVCGHGDHRVVMALAVAGLCTDGDTIIDTAEAASVTFPEFLDFIKDCNGNIEISE